MAAQNKSGEVQVNLEHAALSPRELMPELVKHFLEEHNDLGVIGKISKVQDLDKSGIFTASIGSFVILFKYKSINKNKHFISMSVENKHSDEKALAYVLQKLRDDLTDFMTRQGL